jgi:hypothetical protein
VSFLGGAKVEGVVVKNYAFANAAAEHFAGKFVSEAFKEMHTQSPRDKTPNQPIEEELIQAYRSQARWAKARQHLREAGTLKDSPADIGPIIKEVFADIDKECRDEIKERLYAHFVKRLQAGFIQGLPDWYRGQLLLDSFDEHQEKKDGGGDPC